MTLMIRSVLYEWMKASTFFFRLVQDCINNVKHIIRNNAKDVQM